MPSQAGAPDEMLAQMSRRSRVRWGHPLTVAIIVAIIGLVGTVTAAVIGSSSGPDQAPSSVAPSSAAPASSKPNASDSRVADIVIESVEFDSLPSGQVVLTVRGTARNLRPRGALYAVAQPHGGTAPNVGAPRHTWFASDPTTPGREGLWSARIIVDPPPQPFTVQTVELD